MKGFLKILKRIFLVVILLSVLIIVAGVILANRLEQKIGELFVSEANKYLKCEVKVDEINFSLLEHFPLATLRLSGVYTKGDNSKLSQDTLLFANQLNLNFNIIDLYRENYNIKRIDLKGARINLKINKDYSDNYHIFKETEKGKDDKFSFKLQRINLKGVRISYRNIATGQTYIVRSDKSQLKGDFNQDRFNLSAKGSWYIHLIKSGDITYLSDRELSLNTIIAVDQVNQKYNINKGEIRLGGIDLKLKADWKVLENYDKIDITISASESKLAALISELPEHWKNQLDSYEAEGNIGLNIRLSGLLGENKLPGLKINFDLKEGKFRHKKSGILLDGLKISGSYNNKGTTDLSNHKIDISRFEGKLGTNNFNGKLLIQGLKPSIVELTLDADCDLNELYQFFGLTYFASIGGSASVKSAFSGTIMDPSDLKASDFISSKVRGELKLMNVSFVTKDSKMSFEDFSGQCAFNNNDIIVNDLKGKVDGMDFRFDASLNNILPYIILENEQLQVDAQLSSPFVDLYKLMSYVNKGKSGEGGLPIPKNTGFDLRVDIKNLNFQSFSAKSLDCTIRYRNQKLYVNSISMDAFGGSINMSGTLDAENRQKMKVDCDASLSKVDVKRLFREMGNFGQDYILDENLSGTTDALLQLSFLMNPALQIDLSSILASIDLNINNGELTNYQTIYRLGKFIRLNDLSHVKFSTLKNQLLIKDRKIIIPEMDIKSDALNFTISGIHTFDNEINYNIRLLLSEILSRKAKASKKENDEFGIEEEGKKGGTTLYILLTGTVDNPVFRYDSKGVKGKIISSVLNEKENLRSLFNREFSKSRKEQDSIAVREKEQLKKQESGQYIMEWDGEIIDTSVKKKQIAPKAKIEKKSIKEKEKQEKPVIKVDWE